MKQAQCNRIMAFNRVNPDCKRLLTASFDGTAKVWGWDASNFQKNRGAKSIDTIRAGFERKKNVLNTSIQLNEFDNECLGTHWGSEMLCGSLVVQRQIRDRMLFQNDQSRYS